MGKTYIPEGYISTLGLRETEMAIKATKDYFERELSKELNLTRVSAPLFVKPETGLNDDLNGVERPVSFGIKEQGDKEVQVVHSLAKWKRYALKRYGFYVGEGLYTDMNAIRRDEDTSNVHSIYVDQWDWEKVIAKESRNKETLKETVKKIYNVLKKTEDYICLKFGFKEKYLKKEITFVTTQTLEDMYPQLTPSEREYEYVKKYGAIFLMGIGGKLKSGEVHDGRAPDYDDWHLNGDIIVHYPVLGIALELSSMGIRVSEESLKEQLQLANCLERADLPFQRTLLNGELPYTIGGGIGQSRICMFFLRKAHIGEVQSSIWREDTLQECEKKGVNFL